MKQSTLDPHITQPGAPHANFQAPLANLPTHVCLDVINLTPYKSACQELDILKFGLRFCPFTNIDKYKAIKDVYMFKCNLTYKFMFDRDHLHSKQERELSKKIKHYTMEDF